MLGVGDVGEPGPRPLVDPQQGFVDVGQHMAGDEQLSQVGDGLVGLEGGQPVVGQGDLPVGQSAEQAQGVGFGQPQEPGPRAWHGEQVVKEGLKVGIDVPGAVVEGEE